MTSEPDPAADGAAVPGQRALLADGTMALIRRLSAGDRSSVTEPHASLPSDDRYPRFTVSSRRFPIADLDIAADVVAFGAYVRDRLVGVAHFRREPEGTDPEIAIAVAHDMRHRGVASLLLEHLVSAAAFDGIPRLTAEVLAVNHRMIDVIRDSGLPHRMTADGGVTRVVIDVPALLGREGSEVGERYLDRMLARELTAELASLRPVLRPRSLVVIGAGRRPTSVGGMVLRNIIAGGYPGELAVVNPYADQIAGVRCVPSVPELPAGIDLAVLCVPAPAVPEIAEQCGRQGMRALLVISSGISADPALAAGLTRALERYGMRLVGPNCLGLVNTDPGWPLRASFGPGYRPGQVGIAAQSGGVLIGLGAELDRAGLGVSSALSVGDAADVNGDDMLLWWAEDGRTRAAVLYVESVRRPALFARLARQLARRIPVLAIRSGSSDAGRRAAASHTARGATPRAYRDALFAHAGILAVDSLPEVADVLALLDTQPLPTGPRVAVLSNAGGAGVLAADACARHGLRTAALGADTISALRAALPAQASLGNPVDGTATVTPEAFAEAVELLCADPGVDSVLAIGAPTCAGDPLAALAVGPSRPVDKPVVAARLGQPERSAHWARPLGLTPPARRASATRPRRPAR